MFDGARGLFGRPVRAARRWRFAIRVRAVRYRRAWHYAIDRLSTAEAQDLLIDCEYPAGWHALVTLTVDDTLEQALDDFEDHPELRRLIADGCARVGRKWESFGDELYEARRWAISAALQYARDEAIELVRRESEPDDDPAAIR